MSSNCNLLIKNNELVFIDPGFLDEKLFNYIKYNNLKLNKIIITNGHYDHWTGLEELLKRYSNTKVYASTLDDYWFKNNPFTIYFPKIDYDLFFFSSRRRHTRLTCDWSSDVCSSDLAACLRCCRRAPIVSPISSTTVGLPRWHSRSAAIDLPVTGKRRRKRSASNCRRRSTRSEERRVGKECRSRWAPDH